VEKLPTQMRSVGLAYEVSQRVPFEPVQFSKVDDVRASFQFAWDMTFGKLGGHRDHRTGGITRRANGEIFANTFQGKMAEHAVCQFLAGRGLDVRPDLAVMELGAWDSFDLKIGPLVIAIKSTKKFGNLLLLEAADWEPDGTYRHGAKGASTDVTTLVRVDPSPEDLLRKAKFLHKSQCKLNDLKWVVAPLEQYRFQVVGAVTRQFLAAAVRRGQFIPRGATLNGRTNLDADNYYVQACDFSPMDQILNQAH